MKNIAYIFILIIISSWQLFSQPTGGGLNQQSDCFEDTNSVVIHVDSIFKHSDTIMDFYGGPYPPHDPNSPDQWKNVFFTHGLGGAATSWSQAATHVSNTYKALTPVFDYVQESTIPHAAIQLYNNVFLTSNTNLEHNYQGAQGEKSIVVAHSMGGVVTRQLHKYMNSDPDIKRVFGAFATFGSPHQGAEIIRSLDNGEVENLVTKYCNAFWEVQLAQLDQSIDLEINKFWGFLVNGALAKLEREIFLYLNNESLENFTCDNLVGNIGFSAIKDQIKPPIGSDLHPESQLIADLNAHTIDIPNVAVYGVETGSDGSDGHMALREIYSLQNDVNSTPWGASYDEGYIQEYKDLKDYLHSQYSYYGLGPNSTYPYVRVDWWCNEPYPDVLFPADDECIAKGGIPVIVAESWPYFGISCEQFMACDLPHPNPALGSKYLTAFNLVADFDKAYRIIFGHLDVSYGQTGTIPACVCYTSWGVEMYNNVGVTCYEVNMPNSWPGHHDLICEDESYPVYGFTQTIHPGDGVVPAYSATDFPGVRNTYKMDNTNHQQMRNVPDTKNIFDDMFDDNDYGKEFHLVRKQ